MDELSVKESDCIRKSAFTKESISTFFMVNLENRNEGSYLNCLEALLFPIPKDFSQNRMGGVCKASERWGKGKSPVDKERNRNTVFKQRYNFF